MVSDTTRGAPLKPLGDTTPLDGARIDVPVRVGWLLRMARLTSAEEVPRLGDMVRLLAGVGVRTSSSSLHRLETGAVRDGRLVDAYEEVLGMVPGSLRAPIDVLCRTFPYAPEDRAATRGPLTVAEMQALHDPVLDGKPVAVDWMRWARALATPGNVALPRQVALPAVTTLLSEIARSAGRSQTIRYHALSLLGSSGYAGVVLDAVRDWISDPDVQVVNDVMSALGEAAAPEAVTWVVGLLGDSRDEVVVGACLALEKMAERSGDPAFWVPLADVVAGRFNTSASGSTAWRWFSHLLRLLPREDLARVRGSLVQAPSPRVPGPSPDALDDLWRRCEAMAEDVSAALALPHQPVLARLLMELLAEGQSSRSATSAQLLTALPPVREAVLTAVARLAEEHPDAQVRRRTASRMGALVEDSAPARVLEWATGGHPLEKEAIVALAAAGRLASVERLEELLVTGHAGWEVVCAAGYLAPDLLAQLLDQDRLGSAAGAARWWLDVGARLQDPLPPGVTH